MASKDASQQAMMLLLTLRRHPPEGSLLCSLACVLFPVVHLLQELLRLFLVDERQPRQTLLHFEGVEEDAILVVVPCIVDFLVPYHSSVSGRDVHHLQPVSVANEVIRQHNGTLQARVGPFGSVGVGYVEPGDGDGLDLVGLLGDEALDCLLVIFLENRRHGGIGRASNTRATCCLVLVVCCSMLRLEGSGVTRRAWTGSYRENDGCCVGRVSQRKVARQVNRS